MAQYCEGRLMDGHKWAPYSAVDRVGYRRRSERRASQCHACPSSLTVPETTEKRSARRKAIQRELTYWSVTRGCESGLYFVPIFGRRGHCGRYLGVAGACLPIVRLNSSMGRCFRDRGVRSVATQHQHHPRLTRALSRSYLEFGYQPRTGLMTGACVHARWTRSDRRGYWQRC